MAEPLENFFSPALVRDLAGRVAAVYPSFAVEPFVAEAADGLDGLRLLARGQHIANALERALPADRRAALEVIVAALGSPLTTEGGWGMAPFLWLPFSSYIATFTLDEPDAAFDAMYVLTQRFTAEFAMRPFLSRWTDLTFAKLQAWSTDPSSHVRRAVSEGTRPRLPWGVRVPALTADPRRGIALITPLRDDPSEYVRRSVANHLNDVGKDHPELLLEVCAAWLAEAPARAPLVRHALRDRIKKGDLAAIGLLGAGGGDVEVTARLPESARLGGALVVELQVVNRGADRTRAVVDLAVTFPGTRPEGRRRVFKVAAADLEPGVEVTFRKQVSLRDHTTRKALPGPHAVAAQVDGRTVPLGVVQVTA